MRKFLALLLAWCMFPTIVTVCADELEILIKLDSQAVAISNKAYLNEHDVPMIPLREISEVLGAKVEWAEEFKTATVISEGKTASVKAGEGLFYNGSKAVGLNESAEIPNGVMYVPSRWITDFFGYEVTYNDAIKILNIITEPQVEANAEEDTSIEVEAYEDTYVCGGDTAGTNYGADQTLILKGETIQSANRIIYMKFDISNVTNKEFLNAVFTISASTGASLKEETLFDLYEVDLNSWEENKITYNSQPDKLSHIGRYSTFVGISTKMDITDFVVKKVDAGEYQFSLCLEGDYAQKIRTDFYSRESSQKGPRIRLGYTIEPNYVTDLPKKEGFGEGQDPWEWAKKLVSESTARRTEISPSGLTRKTTDLRYDIYAKETTYSYSGEYANDNFSNDSLIEFKRDTSYVTARKAYMKFDISEAEIGDINYAYIKLYCTTMQSNIPHNVTLSEVSQDWNERTLTWNNAPEGGSVIATVELTTINTWYMFDITDYLKKAVKNGKKQLMFVLEDTAGLRTGFYGRNGTNPPTLSIVNLSGDPMRDPVVIRDNISEYDTTTMASTGTLTPVSYKTRLLEAVQGYSIKSGEPDICEYGGWTKETYEATGSFRMDYIDGRWWIIDPCGHKFFCRAVASIYPNSSDRQGKLANKLFGSEKNWAEDATRFLKDGLYFNTTGGWSRNTALQGCTSPMDMTDIMNFARGYGDSIGVTTGSAASGNMFSQNNAMPVFDPGFDVYAENICIGEANTYNDNPYFLGSMSDNELPYSLNMLYSYLTLDYTNPLNAYSYATAWTWFKDYTGKENPSLNDITDVMRSDFVEFVFDRYYKVSSEAYKKYLPDKLFLGSRYCFENYKNKPAMAAAGRYCDVITINYYYAWTPESLMLADWYEWSQTPVFISEFYAMAADSGLPNIGGAGFKVETQRDRGKFYENYCMKMMQSKSCVGLHWFIYQDNDPEAAGDSSNKGIVDNYFNVWEQLAQSMRKVNRNTYELIEYFDR